MTGPLLIPCHYTQQPSAPDSCRNLRDTRFCEFRLGETFTRWSLSIFERYTQGAVCCQNFLECIQRLFSCTETSSSLNPSATTPRPSMDECTQNFTLFFIIFRSSYLNNHTAYPHPRHPRFVHTRRVARGLWGEQIFLYFDLLRASLVCSHCTLRLIFYLDHFFIKI